MNTIEHVVDFVRQRIQHVYQRPMMYGGTPDGVELILHYYHELLSVILVREKEYEEARWFVRQKENCNAAGFAGHHRETSSNASEQEVVAYLIACYTEIDKVLGEPDLWGL